jgi:hypothetical protein
MEKETLNQSQDEYPGKELIDFIKHLEKRGLDTKDASRLAELIERGKIGASLSEAEKDEIKSLSEKCSLYGSNKEEE